LEMIKMIKDKELGIPFSTNLHFRCWLEPQVQVTKQYTGLVVSTPRGLSSHLCGWTYLNQPDSGWVLQKMTN
jgi:hypothetical protein